MDREIKKLDWMLDMAIAYERAGQDKIDSKSHYAHWLADLYNKLEEEANK